MAHSVRKSVVVYKNLGKIYYRDGLKVMKELTSNHLASLNDETCKRGENTLLICEHHPVYTTGIRDKSFGAQEIERLESLGAEFQYTDRGGLVTFHGPGQLMCYPILNLGDFKRKIAWYNKQLEEVGILTCKKFGVVAKRTGDPGVWVDNCKIAAIGFHVSRWVTSHGLALNCNVDLGWFDHIIACGLKGKGITSLSVETWQDVKVDTALQRFLESFQEVFNCELKVYDDKHLNDQKGGKAPATGRA